MLQSIVEHELNARARLLESDGAKLFDKIGRAFGILQNIHLLSSGEAMNLLSLLRLGIDLGVLPDEARTKIDRLFIEAQPGHIQHAAGRDEVESAERDMLRAARLRTEFAGFTAPNFTINGNN